MQFRTQTLFVMMATLAVLLTLTGRAPIPLRAGIVISTLAAWLGLGLISSAARQFASPRLFPVLLGAAGVGLAATALSIATILAGAAFQAQFMR